MKKLFIVLCLMTGWISSAESANDPLEYKVAVIDAGKYIAPTDSSVSRAKELIAATAKIYRITPTQAADLAAKGKELSQNGGVNVAIAQILDGALIFCDTECSLDQLRNFVTYYVTIRQSTGQTHQQAIHGLLILDYVGKTATPKGKTK